MFNIKNGSSRLRRPVHSFIVVRQRLRNRGQGMRRQAGRVFSRVAATMAVRFITAERRRACVRIIQYNEYSRMAIARDTVYDPEVTKVAI